MATPGEDGASAGDGAQVNNSSDRDGAMPDFRPPYVMATPVPRSGIAMAQLATRVPTAAGTGANRCVLAWQRDSDFLYSRTSPYLSGVS
eukprot:6171828-Pleurochrysis_carterae.AAC.1